MSVLRSSFSFVRRHLRSVSLLAVLSLSVTGITLGGYDAIAAVLKPNFKSRDATRYPQDPNLGVYGLKNIIVAYESSLWPSGASRSTPNTSYILNTYIPKIKSRNPDVVVIDIEVWKLTSGMTSSQITTNINKFKTVIAAFRKGLPNTKLGLYMGVPERNWLAACGDPGKRAARTTAWHNNNLRLKPLASAVDIIFPSLYTFYGDSASVSCWPNYARANIREARIYGKPVWAFVWMKYHSTGSWIPRTFWRKQLETVYTYADGVVVWSQSEGSSAWSWSAPWWLETKDFLADKALN
jgi:hypothetical protein